MTVRHEKAAHRMKTMIYGAGSLGTILGALLSINNEDVLLVSRNEEHIASLQANGAEIRGNMSLHTPVKASLPGEICGKYDIIFLMTKQLDNTNIALRLRDFLADDGVICTTQNGIPEFSLREALDDRQILSAVIPWSATYVSPGVSALTSPAGSVRFTVGSPFVRNDTAVEKAMNVLRKAGKTETDQDILSMRWSKLLVNASVSAFSSSLGMKCGDVTHKEKYQEICLRILRECIDVGRASGAIFRSVNDFPVADRLYFSGGQELAGKKVAMVEAFDSIRESESSILQDLRKERKTEIHAINGIVCSKGRELGIPTPFNDCVVSVIEKIENGIIAAEAANFSCYTEIL